MARDLLGMILYSGIGRRPTAGRIVEVEAYRGPTDQAAHSANGRRTARNEAMYGPGGRAYVYQIYGLHHCMNIVVRRPDQPEGVLLRALEPVLGVPTMQDRRGSGTSQSQLARGPGNLTKALGITRAHDRCDLRRGPLRLLLPNESRFAPVAAHDVVRSPRIGIDYAGDWATKPWRFSVRGHPAVSRPPRSP